MKWLSDNYVYWGFHESIGYAGIQLTGLPETVTIKGHTLLRKSEYHISFINLETTAVAIKKKASKKIQNEIIDETRAFLKTNKLNEFKLSNRFRFVQKDVRRSVIVMVELPGADKFYSLLRKKHASEIPLQPFHITLYALPEDQGIGLWSEEDIDRYSVPVSLPELKSLKPA